MTYMIVSGINLILTFLLLVRLVKGGRRELSSACQSLSAGR